jgi:hypothetical protein
MRHRALLHSTCFALGCVLAFLSPWASQRCRPRGVACV